MTYARRRIWFCFAFACATACLTTPAACDDTSSSSLPSVVMTPIDGLTKAAVDPALNEAIRETLAVALAGSAQFVSVERQPFTDKLAELKLTPQDLAEPEKAARLGESLSADFLVCGDIRPEAEGQWLSLKIRAVAVRTHMVVATIEQQYDRSQFDAIVLDLAAKVAAAVGTTLPNLQAERPESPAVGRVYLVHGIGQYYANRPTEAIVSCLRAVQIDPRLVDARLWIARAYLRIDEPLHALAEVDQLDVEPAASALRGQIAEIRAACQQHKPAEGKPVAAATPVSQNNYRRWAILATRSVEETGLPDLLMIDLASSTNIELLERSQLALVTKELELSSLSAPSQAAERLKLGQLLHADALLLLSTVQRSEQPVLQVVVVDCMYGARLSVETLPIHSGLLEPTRRAILRNLEKTRQRFAGGIRWMAGVPSFVSRDLAHDFDELQLAYAQLVAERLTQIPGVAVIESSEAQAIRTEVEIAGEAIQNRLVPVMIEAEYRTAVVEGQRTRTVQFSVTINSAGRLVRKITSPAIALADAGEYLRTDLVRRILQDVDIDAPRAMSRRAQLAALTKRAAALAKLQAWEQAIALREASLLLDPNNAEQRKALIKEYAQLLHQDVPQALDDERRRVIPPKDELDKLLAEGPREEVIARLKREQAEYRAKYIEWNAQHVKYWRTSLTQLDFLIHQTLVKREEALDLCGTVCGGMSDLPSSHLEPLAGELRELEEEKQKFIHGTYRKALSLQPVYNTAQGNHNAYVQWQRQLFGFVFTHLEDPGRFSRKPHVRPEDLDGLREILDNVVPDPLAPSDSVVQSLYGACQSAGRKDYVLTREQLTAFLEELAKSRHVSNQLYGRFGLLWSKWVVTPPAERDPDKVRGELKSLQSDFARRFPTNAQERSLFATYCESLARDVDTFIATGKREIPRPPPKKPQEVYGGTLRFQPVETKVRRLTGETLPWNKVEWRDANGRPSPIYWFVPCGDTCDVLGSYASVLIHREPGVFEELFADPKAGFFPPIWDGRYIWLGSRNDGFRVLDANGTLIAQASGKEGLPPASGALEMCSLEPGRICAVGSMGRTWCAFLELRDEKIKVKVFHESPNVGDSSDPKTRYAPTFVAPWNVGPGNHRGLLVGRTGGPAEQLQWHPLQIDLETMAIRCPRAPSMYGGATGFHVLDSGDLLNITGGILYHCAAPGKQLANGKPFEVLRDQTPHFFSSRFLAYQNAIYLASSDTWCRIAPTTLTVKPWKREPENYPPFDQMHGVSVHFGIIGWNYKNRQLFRASLEEHASPEESTGK